MTDLFGLPVPPPPPMRVDSNGREKPRRKPTPRNGYAGTPGCGPKGETCRSCRHICGHMFKKCNLRSATWTRGYGSDILARSPACQKWEAR